MKQNHTNTMDQYSLHLVMDIVDKIPINVYPALLLTEAPDYIIFLLPNIFAFHHEDIIYTFNNPLLKISTACIPSSSLMKIILTILMCNECNESLHVRSWKINCNLQILL